MEKPLICLFATALAAPAALAQWEDDWPVWETEADVGTSVLVATDAEESALFRAWAGLSANRVLDNGLEIGATGRFEVQKDHPARAGFTGVPAGFGGPGPALQGAFTGISTGAPEEDEGMRARMEVAYLYLEGGYGELRAGLDEGVALRFREGSPSVFETIAAGASRLDPHGTDAVTTRHDLTGPSLKVSYASPRLLGLRAGVSFTPSADAEGLDRDAGRTVPGTAPLHIDNAIEAALNLSRRLPESGVRLRASAAVSTAETDTPDWASAAYQRVDSWSLGGSAEFDTVTLGLSWHSSDNGVEGDGRYDAWTAGIVKQLGNYSLGAEYGAAEDELTGLDAETWSAGIARDIGEIGKIALGYRENGLEQTGNTLNFPVSRKNSPGGIVIEITLSR